MEAQSDMNIIDAVISGIERETGADGAGPSLLEDRLDFLGIIGRLLAGSAERDFTKVLQEPFQQHQGQEIEGPTVANERRSLSRGATARCG